MLWLKSRIYRSGNYRKLRTTFDITLANLSFSQVQIAMKVIRGLYPGVTTMELDNLAAEIAATMTTLHPDYAILAARIAVSNLHKETKKTFTGIYDLPLS